MSFGLNFKWSTFVFAAEHADMRAGAKNEAGAVLTKHQIHTLVAFMHLDELRGSGHQVLWIYFEVRTLIVLPSVRTQLPDSMVVLR